MMAQAFASGIGLKSVQERAALSQSGARFNPVARLDFRAATRRFWQSGESPDHQEYSIRWSGNENAGRRMSAAPGDKLAHQLRGRSAPRGRGATTGAWPVIISQRGVLARTIAT